MISLFTQLDTVMATRRDAVAIVSGDRQYRYHELQADVFRVQQWLQQQSFQHDAVIAIYVQSRYHAIVSIIACLRAGLSYLPLDPVYPHDRLVYMVDNAKAACVLHDGLALTDCQSKPCDIRPAFAAPLPDTTPGNATYQEQIGYVIYTSGSTGKPKGVMLPLSVLSQLISWQNARYSPTDAPRTLQFSALSFDVSFQEIFSTLSLGATLVLLDDTVKKDFHQLVKLVADKRIERLFMPYIALLNFAQWSTRLQSFATSLREIITAGEALVISDEIRTLFTRLPSCTLSNQYGPSESHVVTEYVLPADRSSWPALPPIGHAINRAEIYLLDEHRQPVADGDIGEIYIAGPVIARGYINNNDETQNRFVDIQIKGHTQRAYRTGDIALKNAHDEFEYKGRADNQVKISGYRIELSEIDVALLALPGISEAAAVAITRDNGQRELAAFVVANHNDSTIWREQLTQRLPTYMVPSHFVLREQLLKTASGKIDRKSMADALVEALRQSVTSSTSLALSDAAVVQLICAELGLSSLNYDLSLLDQGLDSLKSNRLSGAFYDHFAVDIPAYQFFQHASAHSLIRYILGKNVHTNERGQQPRKGERSEHRDIAIIGMAVNVPGASNVTQFWQNLLDNQDSVHFFEPTQGDRVNARGILADPDGFDAGFFATSPLEARVIDPQQRVLLELAWHALEDAGVVPEQFGGRIGVFCGTGNNSYYLNNVLKNRDVIDNYGGFQAMIANEKDYAATRIAHRLNLNGPALSIVTACSTSLVAVCTAVESIRSGQCEMAIAGAASLTFPQQQPHQHEEGSILSRDGHTRAFDADGSGTVFSDGAGLVVLKRLDFALDDGDRIYAVIKGAAINNDGGDKASFSAPSVLGQKRLLLAAQHDANVYADQLSYIEAHGTATPLGDPIEVDALRSAFAENSRDATPCGLGSVKSNLGHLTAAAGVVGLIKTALSIYHGTLPASLHFKSANPQLRLEQSTFYVVANNTAWEKPAAQRLAGVSSFGIGGTNAHVIVSGFESHTDQHQMAPAWWPLCVSARSANAAEKLAEHYQQLTFVNAADVLQQRAAMPWRNALARDVKGQVDSATEHHAIHARHQHRVVLLFPGQGTQHIDMAHGLYRHVTPFRQALDRCFDLLQQQHQLDFSALLFRREGDITATQHAQLALFCVGYSLAKTLEQWGVRAEAALGHSIGEIVAATIAEVFTLEQALRVVVTRGRVMQQQPAGSMAAVRAEFRDIQHLLPDTVTLAAENATQSITISGPSDDVREACERLKLHNIQCKTLQTSHAFHSAMMQGAAEQFRHQLADLQLQAPRLRFASCVTGDWISEQQATSIDYWAQQIVQPVQFKKCLNLIADWQHLIAIECGPKQTVNGLLAQCINHDCDAVALLPSADGSDEEVRDFSSALGQLWNTGLPLQWPLPTRHVSGEHPLPLYPFQHQSLLVTPDSDTAITTISVAARSDQNFQESVTMSAVIVNELKALFAQASGLDMSQANVNASFFELGLDSLFLTQSIAKIKKQYGVNISFRELLKDYNNLDALATFLASKNPAKANTTHVANAATTIASPAVSTLPNTSVVTPAPVPVMPTIAYNANPSNPDLMAVIAAQMQVLSQQLALLGGQSIAAPLAQTIPTVANVATPSAPVSTTKETNTARKPFGAAVRINVKRSNDMTEVQAANFQKLAQGYNEKFKSSKTFAQANRHHLADPRVVSGFRTPLKEIIYPIVVDRSEGSKLWDIDGNQFIDITCGFGSNFFGNGAPFIKKAVAEQLERGYEIGPQNPLVSETAKLFCELTGAERVAFCNTGSEAVLGAVRLARTVTSKDAVVMFENDYHGINDEVIVHRAANGHASPAAAGIPEAAVANTMMLDYGEKASLDYIREHADEIAAVLVEPVQSRKPLLQPKAFLQELRQICTDNDIALIFDEVITGFRIHSGGAQGYYGVQADLASWGKVVGGGMPIGVISGKAQFMDALDGGKWQFGDDSQPEVGVTYFAGTFVRHPLALAAARAVLRHLKDDPQVQERLNAKTAKMVERMNAISVAYDSPVQIAHCGSLFRFVIPQEIAFEELIYLIMRRNGLHVWDARPCFLTTAHSDEDIDQIVSIFEQAIIEMMRCEFFAPTDKFKTAQRAKLQMDASQPPVPGARLGKDESGKPAWFVPDPEQTGKYRKLVS